MATRSAQPQDGAVAVAVAVAVVCCSCTKRFGVLSNTEGQFYDEGETMNREPISSEYCREPIGSE